MPSSGGAAALPCYPGARGDPLTGGRHSEVSNNSMANSRFRVRLFYGQPLRASNVALRLRFDRPETASQPSEPVLSTARPQVPPTEMPSPQVPATQVPAPQVPSPETPSPQVPATEMPSPQVPATEMSSPQVPAPQVPTPETPSPQVPTPQTPAEANPRSLFDAKPLDDRPPDVRPLDDVPPDAEPLTVETPQPGELAAASRDQRRSRRFTWALGLTFALGLGLGLLGWTFSNALQENLPSQPELRRMALENRALRQNLERQSVELEGRLHKAEIEDSRLQHEWDAIDAELAALGQEQDQAAARAQALSDRLEIFVRRNQSLAQRADLPEAIRRQAQALSDEGELYRAALDREMDRLDGEKQRFLSWIERLDEEARRRLVRGIAVRIIHDERRKDDAARIASLLNGAGAEAHLFATDIANPKSHKGRVYYHGRSEEAAARQIAHMVESIETLHIEPIGVANPFLSLWLVGEPPIASF